MVSNNVKEMSLDVYLSLRVCCLFGFVRRFSDSSSDWQLNHKAGFASVLREDPYVRRLRPFPGMLNTLRQAVGQ